MNFAITVIINDNYNYYAALIKASLQLVKFAF
jgi:hypothetical protein